jgi:hypothetical protein
MQKFWNVEHPAPQSKIDALQAHFFSGSPPPRRRETKKRSRRSIHMLNFTYEDDIKIKYEQVVGISRTYYLSKETISRPPQSRETIPLNRIDAAESMSVQLLRLCKARLLFNIHDHCWVDMPTGSFHNFLEQYMRPIPVWRPWKPASG